MAGGRRWVSEDDIRLADLLDAHRNYAYIGRVLGRSACAVRIRADRHLHQGVLRNNSRTLCGTARLLGIGDNSVQWWVQCGWLRSYRTGISTGPGGGEIQIVEHDDLLAFLENPAHWQVWQPERITEWALREWALEVRAGVRFLTVGEVARRLYVTSSTVLGWIHAGKLPAVKWGAKWQVRESDVRYPEQTSLRGRKRLPPLDDEQTAFVREWWGKRPALWIAAQLGRNDNAVYGAVKRLGLATLGRGYWLHRG